MKRSHIRRVSNCLAEIELQSNQLSKEQTAVRKQEIGYPAREREGNNQRTSDLPDSPVQRMDLICFATSDGNDSPDNRGVRGLLEKRIVPFFDEIHRTVSGDLEDEAVRDDPVPASVRENLTGPDIRGRCEFNRKKIALTDQRHHTLSS